MVARESTAIPKKTYIQKYYYTNSYFEKHMISWKVIQNLKVAIILSCIIVLTCYILSSILVNLCKLGIIMLIKCRSGKTLRFNKLNVPSSYWRHGFCYMAHSNITEWVMVLVHSLMKHTTKDVLHINAWFERHSIQPTHSLIQVNNIHLFNN